MLPKVRHEEGLTLEQQQKAVQETNRKTIPNPLRFSNLRKDAAFERYLDSLRQDAKKALSPEHASMAWD